MILGLSTLFGGFGVTGAASEQAMKLRGTNGLSPYAPSEGFLAGNFVADEVEPGFVFGKVRDFVAARSCPAAWLIEEGESKRIEAWSLFRWCLGIEAQTSTPRRKFLPNLSC
jgi:hypothetical protein